MNLNDNNGSKHGKIAQKTAEVNSATALKQLYEASVKWRAINRAGGCNNLNGHILEVMGGDKTNLNPINMMRGVRETLTKSTTAKTVDAVVTRGGKIIQRVQYKDTAKSIGDTVRRVKAGQYNTTTLKGTTETAEIFNRYAEKYGLPKRMTDTGISSNTTKALARSCGAAKQVSVWRAASTAAKSGGMVGAVCAGGISAISNTINVLNGDKEWDEAAGEVIKDTAGGALSGAGAAAAATVTGSAVAAGVAAVGITGAAATACVVAAPIAVAIGVGCVISAVWDELFD